MKSRYESVCKIHHVIFMLMVTDIHSKYTTLDAIRDELRLNPSRLEERNCFGFNTSDLQTRNTPLLSSAEFGNVCANFFCQLVPTMKLKTLFVSSLQTTASND